MTLVNRLNGWRLVLAGLVAALAAVYLVGFTETGQTAAAQFLAQFRSERFAAITIDPAQRQTGLFELRRLGTVHSDRPGERTEVVETFAEASQRLGFAVKEPDPGSLPAGILASPTIRVLPASEFRFTFDKARAESYFDELGDPEVSLPDRFDGASLVVSVPAAAVLQYPADGPGMGLVVGQSRELTAGVEGEVSLEELREFLLGLPGLDPATVRQLRAIEDWRNTLPIPVPVDEVHWQETTIAGADGLLLTDSSGLGSAAVWQRDGLVYGVAGAASADEILSVADSLR